MMNIGVEYEIVMDETAPKGRRIVRKAAQSGGIGTDSGDQFSDAQLRGAIKAATGKAPAPRMSRDKLIAMFNDINAGG